MPRPPIFDTAMTERIFLRLAAETHDVLGEDALRSHQTINSFARSMIRLALQFPDTHCQHVVRGALIRPLNLSVPDQVMKGIVSYVADEEVRMGEELDVSTAVRRLIVRGIDIHRRVDAAQRDAG